jgi:hypothetical protein
VSEVGVVVIVLQEEEEEELVQFDAMVVWFWWEGVVRVSISAVPKGVRGAVGDDSVVTAPVASEERVRASTGVRARK